jgi:DNA invertase Pin-like site-specific DNA recombinase
MQKHLHQLGWREIEVVNHDLGRSAAGTVVRAGFERMVAEVCLGKVGAVAAHEVLRFARNRREWQTGQDGRFCSAQHAAEQSE